MFIIDNTTKTATVSRNVERVDINILSGQILRVKVSSVEHASKFYIQLSSAGECESMINTYMANKDPKVCFEQISMLSVRIVLSFLLQLQYVRCVDLIVHSQCMKVRDPEKLSFNKFNLENVE